MKKQFSRTDQLMVGRALVAHHLGGGNEFASIAAVKGTRWVEQGALVEYFQKGAQSATSTLVFSVDRTRVEEAFLAGIASYSVALMPGLRRVPSNTRIYADVSNVVVAADLTAEGAAVPVMPAALWDQIFLGGQDRYKSVGIARVETREFFENASPEAQAGLADGMAKSVALGIDENVLTPDASTSIFNGVQARTSTGSTATAVESDVLDLVQANPGSQHGQARILMHSYTAKIWMALRISGQRIFPDLTAAGGSIAGLEVDISDSMVYSGSPTSFAVAVVDPSRVIALDDMRAKFKTSTHAALQMDDAPTNKSTATATGTTLVSAFQTNSVVILASAAFDFFPAPGSVTLLRI